MGYMAPDESNGGKPVYLPTPEEIAEECRKIRATWADGRQREGEQGNRWGKAKKAMQPPLRERPL